MISRITRAWIVGVTIGAGGIGAHAAGVRAAIAVEQALVVLAGRERQRVPAVAHDDEARFLAGQEVLDDDARAAGAERVADEHRSDRGFGFGDAAGDDDTLAGRQAIGLDHDRRPAAPDIGTCLGRVGEGAVFARWVCRGAA